QKADLGPQTSGVRPGLHPPPSEAQRDTCRSLLSQNNLRRVEPEVWDSKSEVRGPRSARLLSALLLDFNIQPLDLLIQGGKGHMEALGGFRLVPVALLQHVEDDVPLTILHDVEQGSVAAMLQQGKWQAAADDQVGEQLRTDVLSRGKHHRSLHHIFQF